MKNSKFVKSSGLLLTALAIAGSYFFFTSASTVDQAERLSIAELSAEMTRVHAEITALKAAKKGIAIFSDPTLGQVEMFAGNFAPRGWALCNGQLLSVAENSALFSLLGTTYGGDGRTTFGLPDLRGRVPVHAGTGPGLYPHNLGSKFGVESTDLKTSKAAAAPASGGASVNVVSGFANNINVRQPGLGVNYIIALTGSYPSRN